MARPSFYGWVAFHCGEGSSTPLQCSLLENPTVEPGGLQSTGSLRVGLDWATSLPLSTFMHWRRKWQPTPVLLPGESQGRGSLVGCHLWGHRVGHNWSDLAAAAASHCVCIPHLLYSFIITGHLGFFSPPVIFVIVNNAVVNTEVYISFWNMVLERIMLSEISQMKKDKHCTISLICGI